MELVNHEILSCYNKEIICVILKSSQLLKKFLGDIWSGNLFYLTKGRLW